MSKFRGLSGSMYSIGVRACACAVGLLMATSACSSAEFEADEITASAAESSVTFDPRIAQKVLVSRAGRTFPIGVRRALDSQNALPPGVLSDPSLRLRLRQLAAVKLSAAGPFIPAIDGMRNGRELLRYLVRCALPQGIGLTVGSGTGAETLYGRLGLAPGWWNDKPIGLDTAEAASGRRWVTACLMAHSNNLGPVQIAVSGNREPLSTEGAFTGPEFRVEEAAFFGDVFLQSPVLYACAGTGVEGLCRDRGVSDDLRRRICGTNAASCGFTFLGACDFIDRPGAGVCTPRMPYQNCGTPTTRFAEVLTTSLLTDADFLALHPGCNSSPDSPECHDKCEIGKPLDRSARDGDGDGVPGCDGASVCTGDPYCCTTVWDSVCVSRAGC